MFISYQTVRNAVIASGLTACAGVAYLVINRPALDMIVEEKSSSTVLEASDSSQDIQPSPYAITSESKDTSSIADVKAVPLSTSVPVAEPASTQVAPALAKTQAEIEVLPNDVSTPAKNIAATNDEQLLQAAMRIANAPAAKGKGKDVLGGRNPWKLNLYDDDNDGRWDRGKLDYNRDDIDDEKWNFKKGRWEKDGGSQIWDGTIWKNP